MPTPGNPYRQFTGVVVSAGKMTKTVKVRIPGQKWDKHIRKDFPAPYHVLVSDPTESAREGDVVNLRNGWRTSKHVHHVVTRIVAPFGPAIEDRPPVPTEEERQRQLIQAKLEKDLRRASFGRPTSLSRVKEMAEKDDWLAELPQRLADARKRAEEAGIVRPGTAEQPMPRINVRAKYNIDRAAKFLEKGLKSEEQAEQAEKIADSPAEGILRGAKAI
ncbi:Ribosomal protein S17 [Macrophomina phaseolina MS6]|uniref:Ribosomal protein S17 n=1 Tax=Macrophomina phaseolina (strain MS6) TaxID=1126212 RepID=K2RY81_MACPH|nr:Ribosomal protein S17 [Macrophomina phaseolina MS6]